ncbi:hypothetical protein Y032_0012g1777 [Ancylostoma ceylanicum]|uniref:Uncharacterized protein n=1 Tax=Ancylostoma ceylanicum TaxID=53326 RepID=A0A016VCS7_9BILA|nr:hypothetical protein Y032_0012g1777 [Ancylostoma ceylanicum]
MDEQFARRSENTQLTIKRVATSLPQHCFIRCLQDLVSTPVYYVFGDALFDMLLLLGVLFGTAFWTFGLIMQQKSILFIIVLGLYLVIKIACCVIGYMAIRRAERLFFFITIGIAAVGLILDVYMFSRAFTAFFDSINLGKIFVFFATMIELLVFIHVIYYSIKLM